MTATTAEKIQAELTRLLYQQAPAVLVGVVGSSALLAWALWGRVDQTDLWLWLGAVLLLTALRAALLWCFRFRPALFSGACVWQQLFALVLFLSGCAWGAVGVLFLVPEQPAQFILISMLLTGIVSSAIISLAAYWPAFYVFALPAVLPYALSCWFYETAGNEYKAVAFLALFYLAANLAYSRVLYATIKKTVQLQFDNLDLVAQLRDEKIQIVAADLAKTRFLAAASHDLRQPIHALELFVSGLEQLVRLPELKRDRLEEVAQRLRGSISGLSALLGSLLDISKLDAGIVEVRPQPLLLQPLLASLQQNFEGMAQQKNLRLRVVKTRLAGVSDAALLRQILNNLTSNALRYTDRGRVVIGCRRRGADVEIQVWDSGMGIAASDHSVIFDEFHQLHNPQRDRDQGLGLGLAIVRRSAKLLGHEIALRSTVGKGSMFSIRLPRCAVAVPAPDKEIETMADTDILGARSGYEQPAMPSPEHIAVMVIDDDKDVLAATADLIRAWGYAVIAAPSAAAALDALAANSDAEKNLSLMLVDSQLANGLNGMDAITTISLHLGRRVPAVLVTGDTSPQGLRDASASGLRVLHKPLHGEMLRSLLAEAGDAPIIAHRYLHLSA